MQQALVLVAIADVWLDKLGMMRNIFLGSINLQEYSRQMMYRLWHQQTS